MLVGKIIILNLLVISAFAQTDSISVNGNACYDYIKSRYSSINYNYNTITQTHDYSNNWDFDNDGIVDGVFFIGNAGAHLYFHLRIVLSSDKKVRDFSFLEFDFPCLGNIRDLKGSSFYPPPIFPQFIVHDFDENGINEIYFNLDLKHLTIPSKWKKKGLSSRYILLQFENNTISIKNFFDFLQFIRSSGK